MLFPHVYVLDAKADKFVLGNETSFFFACIVFFGCKCTFSPAENNFRDMFLKTSNWESSINYASPPLPAQANEKENSNLY